jgi:hypothetical protein
VTLNREKGKQLKFKISRWVGECNLTDKNAFGKRAAVIFRVETAVLKMEAAGFSETSICIYQNVRRHIPEEESFHSHCRENLKSQADL